MKAIVVVGAIALALVSSSALAQSVVRKYQTVMEVNVDAHGQVAHVGTPDGLPAVLVNAVRQTASAWRFKPIQVGGRPVSASTWVNVTVKVVTRKGGGYGVQVVYDRNGPRLPYKHMTPKFVLLVPYGKKVLLLVEVEIKPDGSMHVLRLLKHEGHAYRETFKATRKAIESSHAMPMRVDGKAIASKIEVAYAMCAEVSQADCVRGLSGNGHSAPAWTHTPSGQLYASDSPLQFVPVKAHATVPARKSTSG